MSEARSFFSPLRVIGMIFLAVALLLLSLDLWDFATSGIWAPKPLGRLWYEIDASSLNGFQAGVERYILPDLWDPVIVTILFWPAWTLPAGIGVFFLVVKQIFFRR